MVETIKTYVDDACIKSMWIFLSKKINLPPQGGTSSTAKDDGFMCLAWNQNSGHLVAGGTSGHLRMLQTATDPQSIDITGLTQATNMTSNQMLEGHMGYDVQCVTWNEPLQKVTSSDANGSIVVFQYANEKWHEEMVNNRNSSFVTGMAWNAEGTKIGIAYQDGCVIVGSQDGSRIWSKDLPNKLAGGCCWSPDGQILLVGIADGEVHAFDGQGNMTTKLHMACLENVELEQALSTEFISEDDKQQEHRKDVLVAMKWYAPAIRAKPNVGPPREYHDPPRRKRLGVPDEPPSSGLVDRTDGRFRILIAYSHGVMQLMRNETDMSPQVIRLPHLTITCAEWSPSGGFFALTGEHTETMPANSEKCVVLLFDANGTMLRTLKTLGNALRSCAWDPTGLKMAFAIDNAVFYATIRPDYHWGYCGHTVVYAFEKDKNDEYRVAFYETRLQEAYTKPVKSLKAIACHGDFCCILSKSDDQAGTYFAQLCNGIGTPIDFKHIDVDPRFVAMNATSVVIAGKDAYSIWHFQLPRRDDINIKWAPAPDQDSTHYLESVLSNQNSAGPRRRKGNDFLCAICMGDTFFLAATETGNLYMFGLADGALLNKFVICANAETMQLNLNYKKLAVLDNTMSLRFYDIYENKAEPLPHETKKEIWSYCWDAESEDSIAMNEKGKMTVYRSGEAEEGQNTAGYICQFKGLAVRSVLVDNFMHYKDAPERRFALRDAKALLERATIDEAVAYIEKQPHPRLWEMLAETALSRLTIPIAEHAFVMLKDYAGIQFCKKLSEIQDPDMRRAEVYAYFGKINEAEKIYKKADRMDLVIDVRRRVNEWFTLLNILQSDSGAKYGDDDLLQEARNQVGDHYAEKLNWSNALFYYQQANNHRMVLKCALMLDDYVTIEQLAKKIPDGDELLLELGEVFCNAGLSEQAVSCYLRCDKVNEALDVCIQLNQWETAVQLSKQHNLRDVDSLLGKYAAELSGSNERTLAAVQLYRRAGKFLDAARIVYEIADGERQRAASLLRLKKLYARAKAVERAEDKDSAKAALSGLLNVDAAVHIEDSRMIDRAWRGAEAYHFFMLAHQQLYKGEVDAAMKTALYLTDFDDLLDPVEVYSLLALSSAATRQFELCSRAFMKLEALQDLSPEERESYSKLAMQIFLKNPPTDTRPKYVECPNCDAPMNDYALVCANCDNKLPVCIVTGQPLHDYQFWLCPTCKHRAYEQHLTNNAFCPLCHAEIS